MRKITQEAALAFTNSQYFNKSNTQVLKDTPFNTRLVLHGNTLAEKRCNDIRFTLAGWPTKITRERLRGLCINIIQRKGIQLMECKVLHEGKKVYTKLDHNKWYNTEGYEV